MSLKRFETYSILSMILALCAVPVCRDLVYLRWINGDGSGFFLQSILHHLYQIPWYYHYGTFLTVCIGVILFGLGIAKTIKLGKYQKAIDEIGLKTKKGRTPKVIGMSAIGDHKTKLLVNSPGIGVPQYEAKKEDFASSFGTKIESIMPLSNRSNIEIVLTDKELTEYCSFADYKRLLKKSYTFVVGESRNGPIVENLKDLPHMLIAGATGGGKSVFFNNVLLSLLVSSKNIRLCLLDLKRGVEVAPYKNLPNVKIAKNEVEAVQLLEEVVREMNHRLNLMEKSEVNNINLLNGEHDTFVVAIDEASVLYGNENLGRDKKEMVAKARDLTDQIAKLARACGIHLIIATQKVKKEVIDTKTQENLEGKMCFKMSTIPGSVTILGNKMGYELPPVAGRAVWSRGSDFQEVQAPFLSLAELKEEISNLTQKFEHYKNDLSSTQKGGAEVDEGITVET